MKEIESQQDYVYCSGNLNLFDKRAYKNKNKMIINFKLLLRILFYISQRKSRILFIDHLLFN